METIVSTLIGILAGSIVTFLVSRYYYAKATQDLIIESASLRKLNELMLRAMEQAGFAKFNRDPQGKITGMIISLSANIKGESRTSDAELSIK
jgi:Tfp pilus assembly protein PilW